MEDHPAMALVVGMEETGDRLILRREERGKGLYLCYFTYTAMFQAAFEDTQTRKTNRDPLALESCLADRTANLKE